MPQLYFSTCDATRLVLRRHVLRTPSSLQMLYTSCPRRSARFSRSGVCSSLAACFLRPPSSIARTSARLRTDIMQLSGFRVYHSWSSEAFLDFLSSQGFHILEHATLGGPVLPLCHVVCQIDHEGDLSL